jgi:hypothetical protein
MRRFAIALTLSCLAGVGWAQEEARRPEPSAEALARIAEVEKQAEELVTAWRAEATRLREEHTQAVERAKEQGLPVPAMPMTSPDFTPVVERLLAYADASQGEDVALYLSRAVRYGGVAQGSAGRDAFMRMLEHHPKSPSWAALGQALPRMLRSFDEEVRERVVEALTESPDPDVRGWGAVMMHAQTIAESPRDSEEYRKAKAALLAAREAAKDATVRSELSGPIDLRELLGVGAVPPDIEGLDLEGAAFKLSDYRGKIILLSFWGDW